MSRFDPVRPVVVEAVEPQIDGGRFPVKREEGHLLEVSADVFADGHGLLAGVVKYRARPDERWHESPLQAVENDRWAGTVPLEKVGRYQFTVEAWRDVFGSWRSDLRKKADAGEDVGPELLDGRRLVKEAAARASGADQTFLARFLDGLRATQDELAEFLRDDLAAAMARHPDRSQATSGQPLDVVVDRERARYAAWYEMFPRSQGTAPGR
ncbi:MAG TPA: maltotransferase domain-containing protein, partial [Chloroflexota bacterium]|nr:maltotransferase domain-containing protein [Chloroflexota bacterium]